ncbi:SDR family oxidoreductase [Enterococcus faecalis]|uniref:SDR family oxidoreductase n=1 Tax=Enterococcus faecalis TaxID=1351 RepID=UPI00114229E9|nr:SDR family oxidoreductase [Enterococcus faecalis]EHV0153226.1 SDR family oxidoreductase [Enterococcus faecalis]NSV46133.1 SDR family oxidoreductase [Enterococcus faecalis]TQA45494.1 SDR family oxidoreductase [Enterococcus faecalis]
MKSLSEKVIVIMGASSGIGEATARLLARKGAKLVIAARRQERLIAIKKELPEATILVQQADVTKEEEVQRVIKLTMEKYGRIDVLFNNAGVMPTAPLIEAPKGEWRQMLDINIMGVLNGIAAVLPIMEGLRQEQRENNIKSTIISPGAVQTELYQTISNRVVAETLHLEQLSWGLKAEDIAQAVVFAIDTPDRMSISEMVVRPTTQTI